MFTALWESRHAVSAVLRTWDVWPLSFRAFRNAWDVWPLSFRDFSNGWQVIWKQAPILDAALLFVAIVSNFCCFYLPLKTPV